MIATLCGRLRGVAARATLQAASHAADAVYLGASWPKHGEGPSYLPRLEGLGAGLKPRLLDFSLSSGCSTPLALGGAWGSVVRAFASDSGFSLNDDGVDAAKQEQSIRWCESASQLIDLCSEQLSSLRPQSTAAAMSRLADLTESGQAKPEQARVLLGRLWSSGKTRQAWEWLRGRIRQETNPGGVCALVTDYHAAMDGCLVAKALSRLVTMGAAIDSSETRRKPICKLLTMVQRGASLMTPSDLRSVACSLYGERPTDAAGLHRQLGVRTPDVASTSIASAKGGLGLQHSLNPHDSCDELRRESVRTTEMLGMQVAVRAREFSGEELIDTVGALIAISNGLPATVLSSTSLAAQRHISGAILSQEIRGEPASWMTTAALTQLATFGAAPLASPIEDKQRNAEERSLGLLVVSSMVQERIEFQDRMHRNKLIARMTQPEEILRLIRLLHQKFDEINVATAFVQLSRHGFHYGKHHADDGVIDPLLERVASSAASYSIRSISNIYHSLAKMNCGNQRIWAALEGQLCARGHTIKPSELASVAWAHARGNRCNSKLMEWIHRKTTEFAVGQKLTSWSASTLLWAMATSNAWANDVATDLCDFLVRNFGGARLQELAMTAWAIATYKYHRPDVLVAVMSNATSLLGADMLDPSEAAHAISTIAWATSSFDLPLSLDFASVGFSQALECRSRFTPQGVALLLSGLAASANNAVAHERKILFQEFQETILKSQADYQLIDISMVLYAYATVGVEGSEIFDVFADRIVSIMDGNGGSAKLQPTDIAFISWAYAAMGHDHPELFRLLSQSALLTIDQMEPNSVSMMVWAFATLGYDVPALYSSAQSYVQARPRAFPAEELVCVLWSLAVAGELNPCTITAVRDVLADANLSIQGISQLYAAELYANSVDSELYAPSLIASPSLRAAAKQAWERAESLHVSPRLARYVIADVASTLQNSLAIPSHQAVTSSDGLVPIRLACTLDSGDKVPPTPVVIPPCLCTSLRSFSLKFIVRQTIAIEVYWNALCTTTHPRRPLGNAILRRRLLEARGWKVVGITTHEWYSILEAVGNPVEANQARCSLLLQKLSPLFGPRLA